MTNFFDNIDLDDSSAKETGNTIEHPSVHNSFIEARNVEYANVSEDLLTEFF
ncbi:MAG: hypothetical protein ACJ0HZ_06570 [Woeseiaceae bacterium]